tara:strand:+ start:184 stop:1191 length:1008 start_codon:yes stop_codon:yes gene_type:complete
MFKKIGKFIKRGLKKVGKFFKRAFKKVGKFVGKLGPVGMLGMMLIMPQLGSWWGDFGAWAGNLKGPFSGLMKGIHKAGEFVGTASSTVTEGISSLIKSIPGVGDAYQGFETWAQEQMESARDFLGLQTKQGLEWEKMNRESDKLFEELPDSIKAIGDDANYDLNIARGETAVVDVPTVETPSLMSPSSQKELNLLGREEGFSQSVPTSKIQPDVLTKDDVSGFTGEDTITPPNPIDSPTWWERNVTGDNSFVSKAKEVKSFVDKLSGEEEYDPVYQTYVADNYVPMYESAQVDWTQQGFAGTPTTGPASPAFLQSIDAAFQNDPYYQWMAQQRRA